MPVLANPRHEKFAQLLAEGKTMTVAYELCGYRPSRGNASHLADKQSIRDRVHQLTTEPVAAIAARDIARAKVTAESLLHEAEQARVGAMESKQYNAANTAIKNKSVLAGVWIERAEIGSPGEFDHLNDDELERLLVERLGALGLSVEVLPDSDTKH